MPFRDIVVIGTSAGGVRALQALVRRLPSDLPAALFIVMHASPNHRSLLPQILGAAGQLRVAAAADGDKIENGTIYVAPNNCHMVVAKGVARVFFGPKENLFRPAIDPLFRSAARTYGQRVIGVLLSGGLDDGCNGLREIKGQGGVTVIQDPEEAEVPDLPLNALRRVEIDQVLPIGRIADFLADKVAQPIEEREQHKMSISTTPRRFEGITCPDCDGPIFEPVGAPLRFDCIVGHCYAPETMRAEHGKKLENALWSAIATFEEHATILRRIAQNGGDAPSEQNVQELEEAARQNETHAAELRSFVEKIYRHQPSAQ